MSLKGNAMRTAAVVLVACLVFASTAQAQRARGGGLGPVGPRGANLNVGAAREQNQARAFMAQQQREEARKKREAQFETAVGKLQSQEQAIKDRAAAEMRPLTPREEAQVAALDARVVQMKDNREKVVAEAKDKAQDVAKDARRARAASSGGDCIASGRRQAGQGKAGDGPNGALAGMNACGF